MAECTSTVARGSDPQTLEAVDQISATDRHGADVRAFPLAPSPLLHGI